MPERFDPPGMCPVCGADVLPAANACPGCGACHGSGWSEQAAYDALDLPEDGDGFDYQAFVADEFGQPARANRRPRWVSLTAAGLILLLLIWLLGLLA